MFSKLKLDRPLAVFDIEATGLSPRADRIVELPLGFSVNLLIMIVGNALGSLTFSKI